MKREEEEEEEEEIKKKKKKKNTHTHIIITVINYNCTGRYCPTIITVIPLRNHRLNPYILHTRLTVKHLIIVRVGTTR